MPVRCVYDGSMPHGPRLSKDEPGSRGGVECTIDPQLYSVSRSLLFDKAQVLALARWWARGQAPGTTVTEEGVKAWVPGGDSRDCGSKVRSEAFRKARSKAFKDRAGLGIHE